MSARAADPVVVLVGRPNVGKSTLFNRITGARRSIVAPVAGTTRDTLEAAAEWQNRPFTLVDTGGLFGATTDPLHALVVEHGLRALGGADVVVFVVDGREGRVPGDEDIAKRVHALGKPVVLAVNKTDDRQARHRAGEFSRMGLEPVVEVAAEHGDGVADLLDEVVKRLPAGRVLGVEADETSSDDVGETAGDDPGDEETAIAIVGRPNVGKSSLVNRLVRAERVMVSEMPGTTRDSVDVVLQWQKRRLRLVDTAGMRRPGRVASAGTVEAVSVVLARRAMARADVVVLVVDAMEGAGDREGAIAGEAERAGCGIVIAVNKWDLVKGRGQEFVEAFDDKLRFQLKFLEYAPIVHLSALTGDRTARLLEVVDRVARARRRRVPTPEPNRVLHAVTSSHAPASKSRRDVRVLYAAQTKAAPPTFVLFTNVASELHFSYERYLTNQLRKAFGFEGTPIRLSVRGRKGGRQKAEGKGKAEGRRQKAEARHKAKGGRQKSVGKKRQAEARKGAARRRAAKRSNEGD